MIYADLMSRPIEFVAANWTSFGQSDHRFILLNREPIFVFEMTPTSRVASSRSSFRTISPRSIATLLYKPFSILGVESATLFV
jgi:hypothetical protein